MVGRTLILFLALLALAAAAPPAPVSAEACTPGEGDVTLSEGGHYVWVQPVDVHHVSFGVWQESNGIAGLQRSDPVFDETCGGQVAPDTEIIAWYAL